MSLFLEFVQRPRSLSLHPYAMDVNPPFARKNKKNANREFRVYTHSEIMKL